MNLLDKIYIGLFTKTTDLIRTKDGYFEFKLPKGYRYLKSKGLYQIFNPNNKSYLLQWEGLVLEDKVENIFNAQAELKNIINKWPNATLQYTGNHDCICIATITEDQNQIVYTWFIGELNKRINVSLLLDGNRDRKIIDDEIIMTGEFLNDLKIKHGT